MIITYKDSNDTQYEFELYSDYVIVGLFYLNQKWVSQSVLFEEIIEYQDILLSVEACDYLKRIIKNRAFI
ncbi:MAG TPA: hypothetical protein VHZ50_10070 [Puia sp.]|jgi:hypothetical protein|nr:hypothetical protein [Puia sp.]